MVNFNRKPSQKSADEEAFDKLNSEYIEKFGKPYVFGIGTNSESWAETLADVRRRIDENDPQREPEYTAGVVY